MTEEDKVKQEPVQLDLFEEPDASAINKEADPKTLELFRKKSDFLLTQSSKNPFTFSEIYLRDFIGYVFERKNEYGIDTEPFEEEGSHEYLDIWLPQHDKHVKKVDYSGYGIWRYNPIVLYRTKENGKLINKHSIILKDYACSEKARSGWIGVIFGVLGIVFSSQAKAAFNSGNMTEALSKSKNARLMCILGLVMIGIGAIATIVLLSLYGVGIIAGFASGGFNMLAL